MSLSETLALLNGDRKIVLNVGCGPSRDPFLEMRFPAADWQEFRLDIEPSCKPDVVASIVDMGVIPDASVDAIWSSHNLEHLQAHEVARATREFLRVLKPGGVLAAAVPDLQAVAAVVAEDRMDKPLYESGAGAVMPLDVIYGYTPALAAGQGFMAHRTGFTARSLGVALVSAGFDPVYIRRQTAIFEIQAEAYRPSAPENDGTHPVPVA